MVGAVVVRNGEIVGEGWHQGVGTPHAEAMAFAAAGEHAARGATIYVTLEPCSFTLRPDGTPRLPCSQRCIDAGVRRVVAAMADPDARVSGTGFAALRAAGVSVTLGVEEARARALNYAYIRHRTTGLPFITHKSAMTLDGKIAAPGGDSKWVTGEAARAHVHRLRNRADALVVGVGTVLADDPSLTTRLPAGAGNAHDPVRVIIDSTLRTPPTAKVARAGTLILATEDIVADDSVKTAAARRRAALEEAGAEVVLLPLDAAGHVDVQEVATLLAERGLIDVILEGGGRLAASFWEAGLVCRALFFIAPKVIGGGGRETTTPVEGRGLSRSMADAAMLGTFTVRRWGPDIALEAEVVSKKNVHRNH
jgi:diaminohydroxyphosphoribosylaminopyrimidine deaminase/5-amino-6-(5-phosphoribosylamino)uracil reductase